MALNPFTYPLYIVIQSYRHRQPLSTRPAAKPNHEVNSLIPIWILGTNFPFGLPLHLGLWSSSVRFGSLPPIRFGSGILLLSGSVRVSSFYSVRIRSPPPIRFGSGVSSYSVRFGSPPSIRFGSDLLLLSGSDRVFFLTGSENLQLFPASYFRRTTAFSTILNFLWHYKTFQTAVTTYRINHKH